MNTVLFLSRENYYTGRFAEEYFNYRAIRLGPWRADSRALNQNLNIAPHNGNIAPEALARLKELNITPIMASRRPAPVCIRDIQNATLVIALCERTDRPLMAEIFPMYEDMIIYWNIEGLQRWPAERALPMLQNNIDYFLRQNCPSLSPEIIERAFA